MKRLAILVVMLVGGCGGAAPFAWPTDSAGLAALAICGNGDVVCPDGDMCDDGGDCYPLCPDAQPVGDCSDVGACDKGYACVHALCVAFAGSPVCMATSGAQS